MKTVVPKNNVSVDYNGVWDSFIRLIKQRQKDNSLYDLVEYFLNKEKYDNDISSNHRDVLYKGTIWFQNC